MISDETYRLDVWKGDWGLPSIDIHCLQVMAYAKFSGIPLAINSTCNPFKTPNGQLPVLRTNMKTLDSIQDIVEFLRTRNVSPESSLSSKQCAEIVSYEYMLKEDLYPALHFIWWLDHQNFTEFIRPWYAKAIPFPLNFYYPSKYAKHARAMIEVLFPNDEIMSEIENKIYARAQQCMNVLSTRLGECDYFFGSKPSLLDAYVYSYLAPLLKAPLPNLALQNHLKACTNLVKFVSRISIRYFEDTYQEYEKLKAEQNAKLSQTESKNEFPHKRRNQILAGIFATFTMISYAIVTGIVEVQVEDDNEMVDEITDYASKEDVED